MAIEPEKLKAFAAPEDEGGGGGEMPEEDGGEGEGEEEPPEEGEGQYAALVPLLEEFAEDIEGLADELDPDLMSDYGTPLEPEDQEALEGGVSSLDQRLQDALRGAGSIPPEKAEELAQHLAEEDMIGDEDRFAAYLERATHFLSQGE